MRPRTVGAFLLIAVGLIIPGVRIAQASRSSRQISKKPKITQLSQLLKKAESDLTGDEAKMARALTTYFNKGGDEVTRDSTKREDFRRFMRFQYGDLPPLYKDLLKDKPVQISSKNYASWMPQAVAHPDAQAVLEAIRGLSQNGELATLSAVRKESGLRGKKAYYKLRTLVKAGILEKKRPANKQLEEYVITYYGDIVTGLVNQLKLIWRFHSSG